MKNKYKKLKGEEMTYSEKIQEQLKGKTISFAKVDGDGITLIFTDESQFDYEASDGGYSTFSFSELKGE